MKNFVVGLFLICMASSACVARWGDNWNLDKVITAIRECAFE